MDTFDVETVKDSLPRVLERVADIPTFDTWLVEQGIDRDFLFAAGLAIKDQGHDPMVAFLVGVCVAWEVARQ
jgi:hypothetical protein